MTDTLTPKNEQLVKTTRVLRAALDHYGFDFGVFISVVVDAQSGNLKVELALEGDGPSTLERKIPEVLRRLASEVENRMAVQTKQWMRTVS